MHSLVEISHRYDYCPAKHSSDIFCSNILVVKVNVPRMYQSQPIQFRELYIFILWEKSACVCYVYVFHS